MKNCSQSKGTIGKELNSTGEVWEFSSRTELVSPKAGSSQLWLRVACVGQRDTVVHYLIVAQ